MSVTVVAIIVVLSLTIAWAVHFERKRSAALSRYWSRSCTGRAWQTAFPSVPKSDIREFLHIVVDAFGFDRSRALNLLPDDSIQGLYRACYPDASAPDALELETLERSLSNRYGSHILVAVPEEVTFGKLFARAAESRPNKSLERGRGR